MAHWKNVAISVNFWAISKSFTDLRYACDSGSDKHLKTSVASIFPLFERYDTMFEKLLVIFLEMQVRLGYKVRLGLDFSYCIFHLELFLLFKIQVQINRG